MKRLLLIAALFGGVILIGTAGFMLIEGWPAFDSFYMTLLTLTTIGGEVHPLSFHGRVFISFLMLIGVTTVFVCIAILGDTLLRLEMTDYFGRRRRDRMLRDTSGHYIVCGAGRVGRSVIQELLRSESTVVLIDNRVERARWATDKGVITLVGDATKDEVLRQAHVETAKGLVAAIASDAENVYVALSAKVLNPKLLIAARASDDQAEEKLRRAGATTVFTPYSFIGHRLAQSLLRPHVTSFMDIASAFRQPSDLDLEIEQLPIGASSSLVSRTLEELRLGNEYGVIVLAVRHKDGVMRFNPAADLQIQSGDVLIAMGERPKLKRLDQEIGKEA
ncbi:MAG TPA: potassium channel protein [Terriglobia bacterium]